MSKTWNISVSLWNFKEGGNFKVQSPIFFLILLENFFLNDPEINYDLDTSYMSHKEKYEEAIRRSTIMVKKVKQLQTEGRLGKELFA